MFGILLPKNNLEVFDTQIDQAELDRDYVTRALKSLREYRLPAFRRRRYVLRTLRHAAAWALAYLKAEIEELNEEFVSRAKGYSLVMISDRSNLEIRFVFRLTTVGLDGYTEYGIRIRKVGEYFACQE